VSLAARRDTRLAAARCRHHVSFAARRDTRHAAARCRRLGPAIAGATDRRSYRRPACPGRTRAAPWVARCSPGYPARCRSLPRSLTTEA
jgi:hypothetical protein